ncbi:hypothetical protein AMEX_G5884 [Astyanax mexicanus]|uniref:Uncharacterized protein n=1 Tax=Astyanax mexicanus TaxID=7994 RepID=A0A8T2M8Z1_ASTMX|nr:hypothetical protein AMEX_G5884 [Astyanax mexicanus]
MEELMERWPALFTMDEINHEFLRITTVPLQPRFLASLDKHHSKLTEMIRKKGGVVREKTQNILKVLDQVGTCLVLVHISVWFTSNAEQDDIIKYYFALYKEAEAELKASTMAVFVIRENEDPLQSPHEIGIVLEGVEVLSELLSVAHAFAMLFGLIYAVNLSYPRKLKYTFDALQKIFMEIEPKKMTRKVCSLSVKL